MKKSLWLVSLATLLVGASAMAAEMEADELKQVVSVAWSKKSVAQKFAVEYECSEIKTTPKMHWTKVMFVSCRKLVTSLDLDGVQYVTYSNVAAAELLAKRLRASVNSTTHAHFKVSHGNNKTLDTPSA